MSIAVKAQEVRMKEICISDDTISEHLLDGRTISVPLA